MFTDMIRYKFWTNEKLKSYFCIEKAFSKNFAFNFDIP